MKKHWKPIAGRPFWFISSDGHPLDCIWEKYYKPKAFLTGIYPSRRDALYAAKEIKRLVKQLRVLK